jgi:CBS domain containing-hemolysin-like protein
MVIASGAAGVPVAALLATVALIAVNGFFVATEFALLAARRDRIQPEADEGRFAARQALRSMGSLGTMLAGSQLGITVASLGLGAVAEPAVASLLERAFGSASVSDDVAKSVSVVLALALVVFLHLLFGEMMPKTLALASPERLLFRTIVPARAFVWLFRPVIWALNAMARGGSRLLGVEPADELRSARTAAEIGVMLEESRDEGLLEADESALLAGVLAFVGRRVRDVMVPVERVVAIGLDDPIDRIEAVFRDHGHSRLVVRSQAGRMFGFVHVKDVLALPADARDAPLPRSSVRLTFSVEPDADLGEVLLRMRAARRHLALVVDEAREVVGMVTLEEIVESIIGDIADETDVTDAADDSVATDAPVAEQGDDGARR